MPKDCGETIGAWCSKSEETLVQYGMMSVNLAPPYRLRMGNAWQRFWQRYKRRWLHLTRPSWWFVFGLIGGLGIGLLGLGVPGQAMPPATELAELQSPAPIDELAEPDIPEEILRTEIITAARSPIDGSPLTAAAYAELQAELQTGPTPAVAAEARQIVSLLRIRRAIRTIFPFLLD